MTKLSQLFTRKTPEDDENMEFRGPVASEDGPGDIPTEAEALGPDAEKEASVQLGRACEALRNLIVEACCAPAPKPCRPNTTRWKSGPSRWPMTRTSCARSWKRRNAPGASSGPSRRS